MLKLSMLSLSLREWVEKVGGLDKAGKLLGVHPETIKGWYYQKSTPLPLVMREIVRISRGAVTFDQIIAETKGVRPLKFGG